VYVFLMKRLIGFARLEGIPALCVACQDWCPVSIGLNPQAGVLFCSGDDYN